MRRSIGTGRNRLAAIAASVLLAGSALAAAAAPAQAATARAAAPAVTDLPVNTIAMASPGPQTTDPIATAAVPVTATETDATATLKFTVTSVPAGPFTITEPAAAGDATVGITGAFTAAYNGVVTVTATAPATAVSSGGTKTVAFDWTAATGDIITVPSPAAQSTAVGTAVTGPTIRATDSDATATLAYASATLPPGLVINAATGVISGTPATRGTYDVTVTATDQTGATGTSKAFAWTVTANTIVVKAKPPARAWTGIPVRVQATATDSAPGQAAALTWTARNLPAGLTIGKTTGLISGRVLAQVTRTAVVTATDALGTAGSASVVFKIGPAAIIINPGPQVTTTGTWKLLSPIKATDEVPGDKPHYTATGLPPGMGFQGSPMLLYGWPTAAGSYTVTVHETGSLHSVDEMTFRLTVRPAPDSGAAGQIRLALDGKCLQDPGGRTANGTPVRIENCAAGATERWTVVADGTIRVKGRCLDIAGAGGFTGRPVQLTRCGRSSPRQLWAQSTDGELVSPASGLCLTDPGASRASGTVPVLGACHARPYAQWTLPAQPVLTALGGYCADDHSSSGVNGNKIDMFWCNATPGQDWTFRTDGTIRTALYADKCLTIKNRKAQVETCGSGYRSQRWTVVRTGTMSAELAQGGTCLAVPSLTTAKGTLLEPITTQLVTSRCSPADPRDLWHIA